MYRSQGIGQAVGFLPAGHSAQRYASTYIRHGERVVPRKVVPNCCATGPTPDSFCPSAHLVAALYTIQVCTLNRYAVHARTSETSHILTLHTQPLAHRFRTRIREEHLPPRVRLVTVLDPFDPVLESLGDLADLLVLSQTALHHLALVGNTPHWADNRRSA